MKNKKIQDNGKRVWLGLVELNVGLELRSRKFADDLGLIHKDGLETCHHKFDLPWRGSNEKESLPVFTAVEKDVLVNWIFTINNTGL